MKTLFTALFYLFCFHCFAQTQPTKYFDARWKPLKNSDGASFYRIATKTENNTYLVNDYYISDRLQMTAVCSEIDPTITTIGAATLYHEGGAKQQEGAFVNDEPTGLHKYYSKLGAPIFEIIHRGKEQKYVSYFDNKGLNHIHNGKGSIIELGLNQTTHREILDSTLIELYTTFTNSTDTIYGLYDREALYPGGSSKMYSDLNNALVYPRSARKTAIEGKVFVQFIVGKSGAIGKIKILKSLSPDCDDAAKRSVSRLKNWTPAQFRGKSVATLFVLPITFSLN